MHKSVNALNRNTFKQKSDKRKHRKDSGAIRGNGESHGT